MIVEPMAGDRLEDNLNPVGRLYYAASTMICVPTSLSQEVGAALGAQAGEAKLARSSLRAASRTSARHGDAVQHGPGGSAIAMPTTRAWRSRERLSNHGRRPLRRIPGVWARRESATPCPIDTIGGSRVSPAVSAIALGKAQKGG